jgi:hypothetical protein
LPTDSVDFTAIYRSPIKWVIGQKQLLIGAESVEYSASADSIFQPADLGVVMQSTHGSNAVQSVSMGQYVLFPAENGTRVRAMRYIGDVESWVSPDLTQAHPGLCASGIKRMVRMRSPHQMLVVVLNNGQIALLHLDATESASGWSRMDVEGPIKDCCVMVDNNGVDTLYMVVRRRIGGARKLYIEQVRNWTETGVNVYMHSFVVKAGLGATNVVTGLGHLEGQLVHVLADGNFYGTMQVTGGQVSIVDNLGDPVNYTYAYVGLPMVSTLATLPLIGTEPSSKKRYTSIIVRTYNSSRPLINGERIAARSPQTPFGRGQPVDLFGESEVVNMGSDESQVIEIQETIPFRTEIVGIFGSVSSNKS